MVMPALLPRYTVDMLDDLPDDPTVRFELIDGYLLVTPAAGTAHAELTMRLVVLLAQGLPRSVARVAPPGEVQVGPYHRLVPDILIYSARFPIGIAWKEIDEWYLAIEIVSRSSAFYDREHKRRAHLARGVQEYWVVDPQTRCIEIWRPRDDAPSIHRDRVVYHTPDGEHTATVDLAELFQDVPGFLDQ